MRGILRVGLDAGCDHRKGEGEPTVNFFKPGEARALHTVAAGAPAEHGQGLEECPVFTWDDLGRSDLLPVGHQLGEAVLLFSKVEDSVVEAQVAKLNATKAANEAAAKAAAAQEAAHKVEPQKPEVTFEDFGAMDIRTATVLEAERVPKTDKLLKLTIDTGIDKRTIVSGIAEYYSPEDMLGKQICILANLKPRVIRGIESKGMILMAKQGDGKMRFVTPQEVVANGAVIG
ncbi:MAG: methionine--tRNA ligase subunit beta [Bacteroidales bacterium]|nr:methionine--tRNA ligase subunit beta [Bacteroidales bacterium]